MRIILASSNKGKIAEFKAYLSGYEVLSYSEVMEPFEIEEYGKSFKENAIIKSRAVFDKLNDKNAIVLSDDSGISVPLLGGIPGIYSARFAGKEANAKKNLELLIQKLKDAGVERAKAFYTAAIALSTSEGDFSVHGWMYGEAVTNPKGSNGFGYDPMFIPKGFDKTLGELEASVKEQFSHRARALKLALILLKTLTKDRK
ncbi:MAG: RdgB/HAM1 family non-canonical purine NTP pyrophosphatase [Campylobacteraceae bacterium]|jgi:XTP/dITP diphosphohydrolase|nr:RdgB/HAM1 family non-canonical purine NTP pyrophosphatase [Campylobacteraceae bacterium]